MKFVKKLTHSVTAFFFPPLCLHCQSLLNENYTLFCAPCSDLLEFIDPLDRCPSCFSKQRHGYSESCSQCKKSDFTLFSGLAAALHYFGPATTLVKNMKYHGQHYLAEGAAAFMVMQWAKLEWPLPDIIIPAPITPLHRFFRGYNQSALIAKYVGKILNRPVKFLLRRESSGWRQAGQTKKQREKLRSETFFLRSPQLVYDKRVLLIDDVLTTSTTMRCCANALALGYPQAIYGLSLCGS